MTAARTGRLGGMTAEELLLALRAEHVERRAMLDGLASAIEADDAEERQRTHRRLKENARRIDSIHREFFRRDAARRAAKRAGNTAGSYAVQRDCDTGAGDWGTDMCGVPAYGPAPVWKTDYNY